MSIHLKIIALILFIVGIFFITTRNNSRFFTTENLTHVNSESTNTRTTPTQEKTVETSSAYSAKAKSISELIRNFDYQDRSSLNELKNNITSKEVEDLKTLVNNKDENGKYRQTALYVLTEIETPDTTKALAEIAISTIPVFDNLNNPHSRSTYQHRAELALRMTALETLDQRSIKFLDVQKHIQAIETNQTNPTLKFLARISLEGILSQRPGKLHRATEAILAEKE